MRKKSRVGEMGVFPGRKTKEDMLLACLCLLPAILIFRSNSSLGLLSGNIEGKEFGSHF